MPPESARTDAAWPAARRKQAQTLYQRGLVATILARYPGAISDFDKAAGIAEACGDDGLALRCMSERVTLDYLTGELDQGLERGGAILRHAAVAGHPEVVAKVHSDIGNLRIRRCEFREAERSYRASIELADREGMMQPRAVALFNLANSNIIEGCFREALDLYGQALRIFETVGDVPKAAQVHKSISQTHLRLENVAAARTAIETSLAMHRKVCNYRAIAACTLDLANILSSEGRPAEAAEQVRAAAAVAQGHGITDPYLWAVIHGTDAFIALEQGDYDRAAESLGRLIPLAEANHFVNHLARARNVLGLVQVLQGRTAEGLAMIEQGISLATANGLQLELLDGWERKVAAYRHCGDVPRQIESLQRCIDVSVAMGSLAVGFRAEIARLRSVDAAASGKHDIEDEGTDACPA